MSDLYSDLKNTFKKPGRFNFLLNFNLVFIFWNYDGNIANLNEYLHILSGSKANDSDLAWILKLRLNSMPIPMSKSSSQPTIPNPPSVFFKQTMVSK